MSRYCDFSQVEVRELIQQIDHYVKGLGINVCRRPRRLAFGEYIETNLDMSLRVLPRLDPGEPLDQFNVHYAELQSSWMLRAHRELQNDPCFAMTARIHLLDYSSEKKFTCLVNDYVKEQWWKFLTKCHQQGLPVHRCQQLKRVYWQQIYLVERPQGRPLNEWHVDDLPYNTIASELYALTKTLACFHDHGLAYGLTAENVWRDEQGRIQLLGLDEVAPLSLQTKDRWCSIHDGSPPEALFAECKDDRPTYLENADGELIVSQQAADTWQLMMLAYRRITGHGNLFKIPPADWDSAQRLKCLRDKLKSLHSISFAFESGQLDFSHPYFNTEPGVHLRQWILSGLTFDPRLREYYRPCQLLKNCSYFNYEPKRLSRIEQQFKQWYDEPEMVIGRTHAAKQSYCYAVRRKKTRAQRRLRVHPNWCNAWRAQSRGKKLCWLRWWCWWVRQ